jgi:hypothetical protein
LQFKIFWRLFSDNYNLLSYFPFQQKT